MAIGRVYNVDTGATTGISIGTGGSPGTEYVLMVGGMTGAAEFNVSAVRVATYSGRRRRTRRTAPSRGGSAGFPGRTAACSCRTATAYAVGQSTTTAASTWLYSTANGSGTGTYATYGAVLWSQTTPCTAGANWGEWFTPGFELNVGNGPGTLLAVTYELGAAGTTSAVSLMPELVISE